jgi:hypothetical protein
MRTLDWNEFKNAQNLRKAEPRERKFYAEEARRQRDR